MGGCFAMVKPNQATRMTKINVLALPAGAAITFFVFAWTSGDDIEIEIQQLQIHASSDVFLATILKGQTNNDSTSATPLHNQTRPSLGRN
jgi:hypothetical protein